MRRARTRILLAAWLAGLLLTQAGCNGLAFFSVLITDFGDGDVAGLWLWREDPASGDYLRTTRLRFQGVQGARGDEILYYTIGSDALPWATAVERDRRHPEYARVELALEARDAPTVWRATSYSASGESELSAQTVVR